MFHTEVSRSVPRLLSSPLPCDHPSTEHLGSWAGLPDAAAHCSRGLCGFRILLPYFALFLGNMFSQLAVGMQHPEALSPQNLPSLREPGLKNGAHLRAAVGRTREFNWF